ncbi:hypothetical protein [Chryseobacterium sp. PMSZPI]|uniref:hypothetical protein n=1 Tax=Chryseobacterium sp. PMSZPI TaxID=1033900 RepID=UPI000C3210EE|nr:hypothetical protein [Chryseobacterium sp. PMSZPI]PKF74658.1 hypothetical protein CW752_08320 [Chryseobacterium sp. PMSZPI]
MKFLQKKPITKVAIPLITILINIIYLNCTSQKKNNEIKNKPLINLQQSKIEKIELTEQTRGTNRVIIYTPTSKVSSLNGNSVTSPISVEEWKKITAQVNLIDLSKISTLQSPTTGRFSDRALAATISITYENNVFTSSSFDAGIPPKELENLYDEIQNNSTKNIIKKTPKRNAP